MLPRGVVNYIFDVGNQIFVPQAGTGGQGAAFAVISDMGGTVATLASPTDDAIVAATPYALATLTYNFAFNGTTFDRLRSQGNNADAVAAVTLGVQSVASFLYGFNGTTFDRLRVNPATKALLVESGTGTYGDNANGIAVVTTGLSAQVSRGTLFNGTTWDLSASIDATTATPTFATGIAATGAIGYFFNLNSSNYRRFSGINNSNDDVNIGGEVGLLTANVPQLFAGQDDGGFDRQRNNEATALLASAARSTTQTVATQTNYNGRGVALILNVTAVPGAQSLTLSINAVDTISGATVALGTTAAITATGTYLLTIYPGIAAVANSRVSDVVPRKWNAVVTASGAGSFTYSLSSTILL